MATISSPHNAKLKQLRRLQLNRERQRSGRFVVEGEDLVAAAHAAGRTPLEGYRAQGTDLGDLGGDAFADVDPVALANASALGSGSRVIAVYEQRWSSPTGPLCVYLHGVRDPGNVGTILRSAASLGASCVAFGPDCADPHSFKAVRASMGAIFTIPLARAHDLKQLPGERVALVAHAGEMLRGPAQGPLTLLIGAEREGLPQQLIDACDRVAHVPIEGDSLNAAMAATIALYELTRVPAG